MRLSTHHETDWIIDSEVFKYVQVQEVNTQSFVYTGNRQQDSHELKIPRHGLGPIPVLT